MRAASRCEGRRFFAPRYLALCYSGTYTEMPHGMDEGRCW